MLVGLDQRLQLPSVVVHWVGPHEVTEYACFGDLLAPVYLLYVRDCGYFCGDSPVHAEELLVDDGREGELIEKVHDAVVHLLVVLVEALGPEIEEGSELPAFVVAPEEVDRVFEPQFDGQDESQDLHREAAPVDVVPEEEVLGGFEWPAGLIVDDLEEVVVLAMHVSYDGDGVLHLHDIGLRLYQSPGPLDELQVDLLIQPSLPLVEFGQQLVVDGLLGEDLLHAEGFLVGEGDAVDLSVLS